MRALAAMQRPGGCPLDLHRLVPVPGAILRLEEGDPEAARWLWAHWGTTRPLRQVRVLDRHADRRLRRSARFVVEFWSADWTPWQAVRRCAGSGHTSSSTSVPVRGHSVGCHADNARLDSK